MKCRISILNDELEELILKYRKAGYSLDRIGEELQVYKNTLITYFENKNIVIPRDEYPSFNIKGSKALIISDTHIGSEFQNLKYIDEAYNVGLREGVCACLHAGDLFQGCLFPNDDSLKKQTETFVNCYPKVNEFKTKVGLGNHDYWYFTKLKYLPRELETRDDIELYGYRRVFFEWNNYMFALDHGNKYYKDFVHKESYAFCIAGHGHMLQIHNEGATKLKVGASCDDIKKDGAYPGFIIARLEGNILIIDSYCFEDGKAILKQEEYFVKEFNDYHKVRRLVA